MYTLDEIILEWQSRSGVRLNGIKRENCDTPMDGLRPGTVAFVRLGGQTTLDAWCSDSTSSTGSVKDENMCMHGLKNNVGREVKVNRKRKKRKSMCRADRIRTWELRGGRRNPKLFQGNGGWQLHIMPVGSEEERVKAKQRDWSKPISATLIGIFSKEAAAHNTFENTYAFDGNDEPGAPIRDFGRVLEWGL